MKQISDRVAEILKNEKPTHFDLSVLNEFFELQPKTFKGLDYMCLLSIRTTTMSSCFFKEPGLLVSNIKNIYDPFIQLALSNIDSLNCNISDILFDIENEDNNTYFELMSRTIFKTATIFSSEYDLKNDLSTNFLLSTLEDPQIIEQIKKEAGKKLSTLIKAKLIATDLVNITMLNGTAIYTCKTSYKKFSDFLKENNVTFQASEELREVEDHYMQIQFGGFTEKDTLLSMSEELSKFFSLPPVVGDVYLFLDTNDEELNKKLVKYDKICKL